MAVNAEKLLSRKVETPNISSPKGSKFRLKSIKIKVDTINDILKQSLKSKTKARSSDRSKDEKETSTKTENELEKQQKKFGKFKLPNPIKKLNPLNKITNFLFNILAGYVAVRLLDNLPMLKELIPKIESAFEFIEEWGGKIFNGLVTLVDEGYKMYDGLRDNVKEMFGEDGQKKFDEISNHLKTALNLAIVAALIGVRVGAFRGGGARTGANIRPRPGTGGRPRVTGTGGGRAGRPNLRNPLRQRPRITSGGGANRFGSRLLGRGASRVTIGASGQLGSRAGLRILKNFVSPIVKRIPIIGGLIDFALNYFVFKEPIGRAAFAAIGATIFGALGATVGSIVPFGGTFIGGVLGGLGGDLAGKWLYDAFFSKKKPIKVQDDSELKDKLPRSEITSADEKDLFKRLIAAESSGEGELGMALVARSVLNRVGLIQSGEASTGTFQANDKTLTGVIMGKNQYQPVTDGSINDKFEPRTLEKSENAIKLAQDIDKLKAMLKTEKISDSDISKLMASTGFRTGGAFVDQSQNVNVVQYKNHYFNTAGNPTLSYARANRPSIPKNDIDDGQRALRSSRIDSEGSKIAGELGRFMKKKGVVPGSIHRHPEHPPYSLTQGHSPGSLHYQGRAIDLGGYSGEQRPILDAVTEFNKLKGISPVQLLHAANDPRGEHDDHVHVAYKKGGLTKSGAHMATLGEEGREFVIDADSTNALEGKLPGFLSAINKADGKAAIDILNEYTSYDDRSEQTIIIPPPPQQAGYGGDSTKKAVPVLISDSEILSSHFDILYQGA